MGEHSAKDKLVKAATRLFFRDGFRTTGIQAVMTAAGVSKMTLYRHFKSKDELIFETLVQYDQRYQAWLTDRVERHSDPEAALLDLFDGLGDLVSGRAFEDIGAVSCPIVRAAMEYDDHGNPVHNLVARHIQRIQNCFEELCQKTGVKSPNRLATSLFLEFQGAHLTAIMTNDRTVIQESKDVASFLIETSKAK